MNEADVLDVEAGDHPEGLDPAGVLVQHVQLEVGVPSLLARPLKRLEPLQLVHLLLQIVDDDIEELFKVGVNPLELVVLLGQPGHVVVELALLQDAGPSPYPLEGVAQPVSVNSRSSRLGLFARQ